MNTQLPIIAIRRQWLTKAVLCGLCSLLLGAAAPAQDTAPALQAQWQSYDVQFPYMGSTTYYSCTGLENRLEEMLRKLGARKDVNVSAAGCAGDDISRSLFTHIRVSLPIEVAAASTATEQFTAARKAVTLNTQRPGQVGSGDCELLEQVRDRLLPTLRLKSERDGLNCVPGQASSGGRTLQVLALVPVEQE